MKEITIIDFLLKYEKYLKNPVIGIDNDELLIWFGDNLVSIKLEKINSVFVERSLIEICFDGVLIQLDFDYEMTENIEKCEWRKNK